MKRPDMLEREYELTHYMSGIPKKIVSLHGQENLTEFVLHDLCCQHCFNVDKAAYFIDNPDFNCLKGIAGFSKTEAYPEDSAIWTCPTEFSLYMQQAPFNQCVRRFSHNSPSKQQQNREQVMREIADDLGFKDYALYSWDLKHNNQGVFLVEASHNDQELYEACKNKHMLNGLSLLSFCPVH